MNEDWRRILTDRTSWIVVAMYLIGVVVGYSIHP